MPTPDAATAVVSCPNCKQPMQGQDFERHDHGQVRVNICFDCGAIWFDHLASVQLAPTAVIELFKEIAAHQKSSREALGHQMNCPRCSEPLTLSFDLCKSGRFSYFACHRGDGRFTPFLQFLREKQFVRTLTGADLQRVRSQVRQITCSECGAPIDLEHDTACTYCHAPISFLDPDTVEKAVRMWSDADARRNKTPAPEVLSDALQRIQLHPTQAPPSAPFHASWQSTGTGVDLVSLGINIIGGLFQLRD